MERRGGGDRVELNMSKSELLIRACLSCWGYVCLQSFPLVYSFTCRALRYHQKGSKVARGKNEHPKTTGYFGITVLVA